ncbi:MAG: Mut7-C RNAse domain-containing protein [Nitrospirota bacterium]
MGTDARPRAFLADAMLGRLARWLRMLGYDTAYERALPDHTLIERVLLEDRWLLTRDGYLVKRKVLRGRHTLLASDDLGDQLRQLQRELQIRLALDDRTDPRCVVCNRLLEPLAHEEATLRVPPFVAAQHRTFVRCPGCRRIYWPGTHWTHVQGRLARLSRHEG